MAAVALFAPITFYFSVDNPVMILYNPPSLITTMIPFFGLLLEFSGFHPGKLLAF